MMFKKNNLAILVGFTFCTPKLFAQEVQQLDTAHIQAEHVEEEDVIAPQSLVTSDAIDRDLIQDSVDLFKHDSGVIITEGSRGGIASIQVRGLGQDRVKVIMDGQSQSTFTVKGGSVPYIDSSMQLSDPEFIKQAKAIKGAQSSRYGSGAMAGVVKIDTKDPEDLTKGKPFGGYLKSGYRSKDASFKQTLGLATEHESFRSLLMLSYLQGEELQRSSDFIYQSNDTKYLEKKNLNILAKMAYRLNDSHDLKTYYLSSHGDNESDLIHTTKKDYHSDDQNRRYQIGLSHDWNQDLTVADHIKTQVTWSEKKNQQKTSWLELGSQAQAQSPHGHVHGHGAGDHAHGTAGHAHGHVHAHGTGDHAHGTAGHAHGAGGHAHGANQAKTDVKDKSKLKDYRYKSTHLSIKIDADKKNDVFDTHYGVSFDTIKNANDNTEYTTVDGKRSQRNIFYTPEVSTNLYAGYVSTDIKLFEEQLIVKPSIRYDYVGIKPQRASLSAAINKKTPDYTFSHVSKGLALEWLPTQQHKLVLSVKEGFRTPSYHDLFFQWENPAYQYAVVPSADLKEETAINYGIDYTYNSLQSRTSLRLFYSDYDDFIDTNSTKEDGISIQRNTNIAKATIKGIEFSHVVYWQSDLATAEGFSTGFSAQYYKGKDQHGNRLSSVSPWSMNLNLSYDGVGKMWGTGLKTTYTAKSSSVSKNSIEIPSVKMMDFTLYYKPIERIKLTAGVFNILDQEVYKWTEVKDASKPLTDRMKQAGRNYGLSIAYQF